MRAGKAWRVFSSLFCDNPFFLRRARTYLRGNRFYLVMTGFVLVVCVVLGGAYLGSIDRYYHVPQSEIALLGRRLFLGAMITQAVVICLLLPLMTAAVVASEKEKQTFDLLKLTTVSAATLVGGEILAAVALLALMLLAALPVVGLVLLVGGVAPIEMLTLYLGLLLTGIVLAALGLFVSATHDKVSKALSSAIGALVLLSLLLPALITHKPTQLLACMNPLMLLYAVQDRIQFNPPFFWGHLPLLPTVLVMTFLATLLLATLAARKLYRPGEHALSGWQMTAVFYLILFVLIAGAWQAPDSGYLNCLLVLFFLLLVYLMNQTVHPGSREAERLRQRGGQWPDNLPLFWLHLVVGNVAILSWLSLRGITTSAAPVLLSALVVSVVLTAYWSVVKLMGLLSRDRSAASRNVILSIIFLLIVPPLAGAVGMSALGRDVANVQDAPYFFLWGMLIKTNPIVALVELQSRMGVLMIRSSWDEFRTFGDPWLVCCVFHGVLLVFCVAVSRLLQLRRVDGTRETEADTSLAPASEAGYGG